MSTPSRRRLVLYPLVLVALLWPAIPARSDPAGLQTSPPKAPSSAGSLLFIENVGQFDPSVFFKVAGSSGALWLADDGLWVSVTERPESDGSTPGLLAAHAEPEPEPRQGVALHLTLDGADFSRAEPLNRLSTSVNYFSGNDPEQWRRDVPAWGGVRYLDAYPGYDLEVTPGEQGWAWRLAGKEVQSASLRADTPQATLRVEGAESLSLAGGKVIASTAVGPVALPLLDGAGVAPVVAGLQASASLAAATGDQSIIAAGASDLYCYLNLGGSESDYGYAVAVDSTGNAYIAGHTESDDFPTTPGAYDPEYNGGLYDAVVSKLDPGGVLTYQTFLGGSGTEHGAPVTRAGIAVDSAGNAYIAGRTNSSDFPTTPGAYATTLAGSYDVFVTKLNASGTDLAYSTLLGGTDYDNGYGIALDSAGDAYVTGSTDSSNFPTTAGAYDTGFNGTSGYDVFVTKLSASGSDLVYSTFLGGSSTDYGYGIALDSAGNAYITGQTYSSNFPTTPSAYDSTYNGTYDAFVTKLNPLGNGLAYSTFLGGSGTGAGVYDQGNSIAVDSAGNAYVTGQTESDDFPTTVGAYDATRDSSDAFVTKFDADGSDLIYSTFLGGTSGDSAYSIALDTTGNAYVTGSTGSADFPTTPGAYDTEKTTNDAAFVTRLNTEGSGLVYSTFLAGSSRGIAVADSGRVWVTGSGNDDAFAASLQCGAAAVEPTPTATTPSSPGEIQLVDNLTLRTEAGHWPPNVGDKIIAHIRVRNSGGENLHVEHIGVRGRRNGSEYWDIGFWTIDLAAGAEWTLDPNNERPLEAGSYTFRISYSLYGTDWVEIGNEVNFTVASPTPVPTATSPAVTPTAQPTATAQPTVRPPTVGADFRPGRDGYSFPNWSNPDLDAQFDSRWQAWTASHNPSDVPLLLLQRLLLPLLREHWEADGHCYGMSASSIAYWQHPVLKPRPVDTYSLGQSEDGVVDRIVDYQMLQYWNFLEPEALEASLPFANTTPSANREYEFLSEHVMALHQPQPVLLNLSAGTKPDGTSVSAHSVVGYAVSENGNKRVVSVYENGRPGQTLTATFDLGANTFEYSVPDDGGAYVWREVDVDEARLTVPDDAARLLKEAYLTVLNWFRSHDLLQIQLHSPVTGLVTNGAGERIGYVGTSFVNEIAGAELVTLGEEAFFHLPVGAYSVVTTGSAQAASGATLGIDVIVPLGGSLVRWTSYTDVPVVPGSTAALTIGPDPDDFALQLGSGESLEPEANVVVDSSYRTLIPLVMH